MFHLSLFSRSILRKEASPTQLLRTIKTMTNDITYDRVCPDRYQDVIQRFKKSFFGVEPLTKALGLKAGAPNADLEAYSLSILCQGLSTMALCGPNDEVVGAVLMGTPARDTGPTIEYKDPRTILIRNFIGEAVDQVDFSNVKCGDIVDLKLICVDDKFGGKGIGAELCKISEEIACELKFKIMRTEATGFFSQRIFEKHGWETVNEIKYCEWPSPENPTFKTESPHKSLKIMIKKLI